MHTLHVFVEKDGEMSAPHSAWFLKSKGVAGREVHCSFFLDGQLYQTDKTTLGTDGTVGINLDMNQVSLGMHVFGVQLTDGNGIPLGYRDAAFMRVPTDLQCITLSAYYMIDGEYKGTLAITDSSPIVHLDFDVASLKSGLHSLAVYLASPLGLVTPVKSAWFVKTPNGGEGVKSYTYWLNDNRETLQTVSLPEVSNPFGLMSLIDVPEQSFRSGSHAFAMDGNSPTFYARNDFNIMFFDPDGAVTTESRAFTDVRVKYKPREIIALGNDAAVFVGQIPQNEIKLYRFDAEAGDSVNVRTDRAAMMEVYSPTAQTLIKATGVDATTNRAFTVRENGTYYVAVHDVAGGNAATLNFSRIHRYALMEQNVTRTANRGCFEMEARGNGFESLQSLALVCGDKEYPVNQYRAKDNNTLCAMIDIDELSLANGEYRLKGIYRNSEDGIAEEILSSSVLAVEDATPIDIEVQIEAPRIARTPYLAYIKVTNRSNVGVWGVPFNIAAQDLERGGKIDFMDFEIALDEKFKETIPVVHKTANLFNTGKSGSFAPTVIPFLGPGQTNTYTIGLTTGPHALVTLYAWTGAPWSEEANEMLSEGYDLSVLQEPFEGNLFTFTEYAKLYYQLENGLYESESEVVNASAQLARSAIGGATYSSNDTISTRMAGHQMFLDAPGSNVYAEHIQNAGRKMLTVGNDLIRSRDTQSNSQPIFHISIARTNWVEEVPPTPYPKPNTIDCYQSGDPNDMKGYVSPSGSNYIGADVKSVTYTVEFENDPEIANAPASYIKVNSCIDAKRHDLSTLKTIDLKIGSKEVHLPAGHHFVKTLDMRPEINAIAELTFDFDASTGNAEWKLRSLDPLTLDDITYMDDGILPVNDDSGRGTGYLTFSVDLLPALADNTTIESSAEIVFDTNAPVFTPVWRNVTDFMAPSARIITQSTADNLTFDFTVEGNDSGSGIWTYDLYMRSAESPKWMAVKTGIEDDAFSYVSDTPLPDATFAVIATDRAGNRQSEASLWVLAGDSDGNGVIDANDVVAVRNYYLDESSSINLLNADVNNDGVTDTQDATAIINLYLDNNMVKSIKRLIIK